MSIQVSVILPCFNESRILASSLKILTCYFRKDGYLFELIVVDDGSTDSTKLLIHEEASKNCAIRYIRVLARTGKGEALRQGLKTAQGEIIFYMDADLPVSLSAVALCIDLLNSNEYDIVIGNRYHKDSQQIGQCPTNRRVFSILFRTWLRITFCEFADTQCCLKAFKAKSLSILLPLSRTDSYYFDAEILRLAKKSGLRVVDIPVTWKDTRARWSTMHSIRVLRDLLADLVKAHVTG